MTKNTVTGSVLAKLLPGIAKFFLENASQEQVNQAEQEAAVPHQQMQSLESPTTPAATTAPIASPTPTTPAPAAVEVPATPTTPSADEQINQLTAQVSSLTKERDQYKGWYEKQAGAGKTLPKDDASDRQSAGLSAYESDALQVWRDSH